MKTLLSKLYSLVFCYLLLGVMFGSWNVVALSLDAKMLILITFIAHALGEFTANVVVEYRHNAVSASNAKYWKDKELAADRGAAGTRSVGINEI